MNGEPFSVATSIFHGTAASFLAGLALSVPPLTAAAVDFMLASVGYAAAEVGISDDFVRGVVLWSSQRPPSCLSWTTEAI